MTEDRPVPLDGMRSRCHVAIKFGTTLTTRCRLTGSPHPEHKAWGRAEFPYQEIVWQHGDRRSFMTDRADKYAWEGPFALPTAQPDGSVVWHGADGQVVEDWHGAD